jgi:putative transposase
MKFAFIVKHRNVWPVAWLCKALDVSRSGFHAWLRRGPSLRAQLDDELTPRIRASFVASARTMAPVASGMTSWPKAPPAGCTRSSG